MKSIFWASVGLIGLSATSFGQITSIGPFTGTDQEGFESQDTSAGNGGPFPPCVVDRVFGAKADLCAPSGSAHITGGWGFGCTIQEHSGARLFGTTGGPAVYTFDGTASSFGGYFGTNNPSASGGTVKFFDAGGAQIGADQALTVNNDCMWNWHGWSSTVPIKSIEVTSNYSSGGFMMMDSMEADIDGGGNSGSSDCDCQGANGPCATVSGAGRGCPNSNANGLGAMLVGSGTPVAGGGTFGLAVTDAAPAKPGLVFAGTASLGPGGVSVPDSAGLLCVGGNTARGDVVFTDASGAASFPDFQGSPYGAHPLVSAGQPMFYTHWFRDPGTAAGCTGDTSAADFNFSNGWRADY